jgi:hypothetical protein
MRCDELIYVVVAWVLDTIGVTNSVDNGNF